VGEGVPVVNLAQLFHRSSLLLVAHADSGIQTAADLHGRKVAVWPEFRAQPEALFRQAGVEVNVVEQGASMGVFLWRGVDAACAMRYNEFQQLYLSGFDPEDLNVIELETYNVGFPEDGIYVLERTLREAPGTSAAFVSASLRGWEYAFNHPEEATDAVMSRIEKAGLTSNRPHQRRMLATIREAVFKDGQSLSTVLRRDDFDFVNHALIEERAGAAFGTGRRGRAAELATRAEP
jgi:NitT/TauT family transport system substrate-binding protein